MKRTIAALLVIGLVASLASATVTINFKLVYKGCYSADGTTFLGDKSIYFDSSAPGYVGPGAPGFDATWQYDFQTQIQVHGLLTSQYLSQLTAQVILNSMPNGQDVGPIQFSNFDGVDKGGNGQTNFWSAMRYSTNGTASYNTTLRTITANDFANGGTDYAVFGGSSQETVTNARTWNIASNIFTPVTEFRVTWDGQTNSTVSLLAGVGAFASTWANDASGKTTASKGNLTNPTNVGNTDLTTVMFYAAPEPATMALLAIGGVGMLLRRRSR